MTRGSLAEGAKTVLRLFRLQYHPGINKAI